MPERVQSPDVIVVGGGNAGFSAAHAAVERGRSVVLLEKGDPESAGGNSYYSAGAFRFCHDGTADVATLIEDPGTAKFSLVPAYGNDDFVADLIRVTDGRTDLQLAHVLAADSRDAMQWLRGLGLRFRLMHERQAYTNSQGQYQFFGGLAVGSVEGGKGLIADHTEVARRAGVEIRYGVQVRDLAVEDDVVRGVRWKDADGIDQFLRAEAVVLAAGGFESDASARRKFLGDGWERAKVRGTPHNTGDLLKAARAIGSASAGDWESCHSVAWEAWSPNNESNRELTNQLTRQSYPIGLVVNNRGERFLDEGADFRNYTYAKYGAEILAQPDGLAFQLFDATTRPMLRAEEYDSAGTTEIRGNSLSELATRMGVDGESLERTITEFNAAIATDKRFDPSIKDGRWADVDPPKSNWALALESPPFYAYPVTCGITFTFGGLRSDIDGRVLRNDGSIIPGLYVCGEMLGGLFSGNYPGGSGLTAGTVFGRRAGAIC